MRRIRKAAEAFEEKPSEHRLFSPTSHDNHSEQDSWKRRGIPREVVIRRVDGRSAEQRHHDRLHQELEDNAQRDADRQRADPALRPNVADCAPRRARSLHPQQNQDSAEGSNDEVAREDDENRSNSDRSESAQAPGESIVG